MSEVFFIIGLIGLLILPFWIFLKGPGRVFWTVTMSLIGLIVVSAEVVGTLTHKLTISRMYWQWSLDNEWQSWIVFGLLLLGWLNLLIHLQWKVMKRRMDKK